ncbi:hypothetical protein [Solibacillus isronensis]|uniref:hypothetical protein n=2 Tax=Solibacillus isronensis TaxID=412383 RepID=UPI003F746FEE
MKLVERVTSMFWVMITIVAVVGILTDTYTKNKNIELKRLDKEIKLEKLRLETYDKETAKMQLELEQTKQLLLETQLTDRSDK